MYISEQQMATWTYCVPLENPLTITYVQILVLHLEDLLLTQSALPKIKSIARFYHDVVAEHTNGVPHIKPGMEIPFTCSVHEKVLFHVGKADLDEKTDNGE